MIVELSARLRRERLKAAQRLIEVRRHSLIIAKHKVRIPASVIARRVRRVECERRIDVLQPALDLAGTERRPPLGCSADRQSAVPPVAASWRSIAVSYSPE